MKKHNMNKLLLFGLALGLGVLALGTVTVWFNWTTQAQTVALTWYVDKNCTICGIGTLGGPFQTINQALSFAEENDIILVAQGTYSENLFINTSITIMGGYTTTAPTWTRSITHYETIITSDDKAVPGDWNGDWLGSCDVVKDDNTYKMWYSGGNEIEGESIGYADSPDGANWFNPLSGPLLQAGSAEAWDQAGVTAPSILPTDDGFEMWYVGLNVLGEKGIGYATSPDGLTWHKYGDNPVLRPDTFDRTSFGFPTVLKDVPDDYKMWYSGGGNVWLATSSDGLNWTKHSSTPALTPGSPGAWDDEQVYAPHVIAAPAASPGRYEMWYVAESTTTSGSHIGYAWSDDGLNWTKSPDNPVLSGATENWEGGNVALPAVIKEGTTYTMWYQGGASNEYAFGQATSSDGATWEKYAGNPILGQGEPTQWGSSVLILGENSGKAILDGVTITGGFTRYGGGIQTSGSAPTIRNCTVTDNVAWVRSGGIEILAGAPLIENTTVSNNTSETGWAGGIYMSQASPTISASLIIDNAAREGGGGLAVWRASQPTLIDVTVANNAGGRGGGVDLTNDSILSVYGGRIAGNTAVQAAGLRARYSTLAMTNTFVVDNQALAGEPGAIDLWYASGRLVNVTIAGNSASGGTGGIKFYADQSDVSLVILNSILAFNGADDVNCSSGTCSVTYSDVQESMTGNGNISLNPQFVDQAQGDYHLRSNSPAIDAGTSNGAPATDFEGDLRPVGAVDMGADEFTGEPLDFIFIFLPLIGENF
jgi:predicted GH43/DUF377 family glycosyl hydrolase